MNVASSKHTYIVDVPNYFQVNVVGEQACMTIFSCFKCQSSKIVHRILDSTICNHKIHKPGHCSYPTHIVIR